MPLTASPTGVNQVGKPMTDAPRSADDENHHQHSFKVRSRIGEHTWAPHPVR